MARAAPKRILFVDDEPSIRLTLPPVLQQAGFDVHVAESVGDAIFEINSHSFDALISDLNIAEEGDGFLVTTAMRHIQPNCATFILTGYPAFETALQAIHSQVDDYLVKPVEVNSLINTVTERLTSRFAKLPFPVKRLTTLLKENTASVVRNAVNTIKEYSKANGIPSSSELSRDLTVFVEGLAEQLEEESSELNREVLRAAGEHGRTASQKKGASVASLACEFRFLEEALYDLVQSNLTSMDAGTTLVGDLRRLNRGLALLLEESLQGFEKKSSRVPQK